MTCIRINYYVELVVLRSLNMSNNENENLRQQNAKVIQLGFNISVSGDPDTDLQVFLDDKMQERTNESSKSDEYNSKLSGQ